MITLTNTAVQQSARVVLSPTARAALILSVVSDVVGRFTAWNVANDTKQALSLVRFFANNHSAILCSFARSVAAWCHCATGQQEMRTCVAKNTANTADVLLYQRNTNAT